MGILQEFERQYMKEAADVPQFEIGDTVRVHHEIIEGDKKRVQVFQGTVIGDKGRALNRSFIVRKVSFSVGVEKTFPLHSPRVKKVEIVRKSKVRRAKLYFLRDRVGKSARLKDRMDYTKKADKKAAAAAAETAES